MPATEEMLKAKLAETDPYKILEINPEDAKDPNLLKKAYHKTQLLYHPDKNPDFITLAEDVTRKINHAYEEITNPTEEQGFIPFSTDPNVRAQQFEEMLKQFQKHAEEEQKQAKERFNTKVKPHLNDSKAKITPEHKTYYILIQGYSPNLQKNYQKDFFDQENEEFRSKIAENLFYTDDFLIFESRENALRASLLLRDKYWGDDSYDIIIECSLDPKDLKEAVEAYKTGRSRADMDELNDGGTKKCYQFIENRIGSNSFSLGNISALFNFTSGIDDEKYLKKQLKEQVIKNNNLELKPQKNNEKEEKKVSADILMREKRMFAEKIAKYMNKLTREVIDIRVKYTEKYSYTSDENRINQKYPKYLLKKNKIDICELFIQELKKPTSKSFNAIIDYIEKKSPVQYKDFCSGLFSRGGHLVDEMKNKQKELEAQDNVLSRISGSYCTSP